MFGLRHLSERMDETIRMLRKGLSYMRSDSEHFGRMLTACGILGGLLISLILRVIIKGPLEESLEILAVLAFFIVPTIGGLAISRVGAEPVVWGSFLGVALVIAGALFFNGDAPLSEIPLVVSVVILGFAVTGFIAMLASPE